MEAINRNPPQTDRVTEGRETDEETTIKSFPLSVLTDYPVSHCYATAYVAGVAAKLMTKFPDLTAKQVRRILCTSAEDLSFAGYDTESGWGVVNVDRALAYGQLDRLLFRFMEPLRRFFLNVKE